MEAFFKPKSVAVIGVSESPQNMARNIVGNLIECGYNGIIHQVGQRPGVLHNRKIFTSLKEIDDPIELAVLLTPAKSIPGIMESCGKAGIRHVIIESAGFREYGEPGRILEDQVAQIARKYGIRFIGPNCIGTLCAQSGLAVPFVPIKNVYRTGGISIVSQSGGVGFSYLTILASESLGIAKFASIGNKRDVDENDMLEYLMEDEETKVIVLYLEGFSDGKRLMELARRSTKPILVQKANRGRLADSIGKSHTAALSSDDTVVDAALEQAGIIRVIDRTTLVNCLKAMALPHMKGNRLAIISRSGGHAILAADASEQSGFELAPMSPKFLRSIEKHFRAKVIQLTNPLDIGDLFDYDVYVEIIEKTLRETYVDAALFMHTYFSETEGEKSRSLFRKIEELSFRYKKPVAICIATDEAEFSRLRQELDIPLFALPGAAVRALSLSREFLERQRDKIHFQPEQRRSFRKTKPPSDAKRIISSCVKKGRDLLFHEGMSLFAAYGIPIVESAYVHGVEEAVLAAKKFGKAVALKIISRDISHKSDFGGVKINVKGEEEVSLAYAEIMASARQRAPLAKLEGIVVQPMLAKGWELILGAKRDPNFGPVVLAGLGGIFVEIFKDVSTRVIPFDREEAREMITELKGYPILVGARGSRPYDVAQVLETIMKLAQLISDFPEIREIDINPFYVLHEGRGAFALDARVVIKS